MPLSARLLPSLLALSALGSLGPMAVACGGSDGGGNNVTPAPTATPTEPPTEDAGPPVDAAKDAPIEKPPLKASFPFVENRGGKTIAKPRVVPIVFQGDPLASQIDQFTQKIAASQYWKDVGAEYGVGAMTAAPLVTMPALPGTNLTSTQIEQWLVGKLTGATPEIEAADENTVYAIYFPVGVTISLEGTQSCHGFGGYHFEVQAGAKRVGYAVMPRCSDVDELTVAASHEYFEWATDPFPQSAPAFDKLDDEHWAWQAVMIGELSDLCTFLDQENLRPQEIGFLVQRHWSNKASLAGKYPCAPAKAAPYLTGIPLVGDDALVPDYRTQQYIKTKALRVAPGTTKEIDVIAYSDQAGTPNIPFRALSYTELYGQKPSGFSYELSQSYAKAGTTMKLKVTAPKAVDFDVAVILAYTGKQSAHYWPVLVTNDDGKGTRTPAATPGTMPYVPNGRLPSQVMAGPRITTLGMGKKVPLAPHHE